MSRAQISGSTLEQPPRHLVILRAVADALGRHSVEIDDDAGLRSVTVEVKLRADTRRPRAVIVTRQSEESLTDAP